MDRDVRRLTSRWHRHDDRGAVMVLTAVLIVVTVLFAAFAVDIGAVAVERRRARTAADAAALAGMLEVSTSGGNLQSAVAVTRRVVDENLPEPVAPAAWSACRDTPPAGYLATSALGVAGGSPCISISRAGDRWRVRVPTRTVDTALAGVVGIDSLDANGMAEAGVQVRGTGAFPVGLFAGVGAGTSVCVKLATSGQTTGNCNPDGPTSGQFGGWTPWYYTDVNPAANQDTSCEAGGGGNGGFAYAVAKGIDHLLGTYRSGAPVLENGCTSGGPRLFPNAVDSNSGYSTDDITQGLVLGRSGSGLFGSFSGRLRVPSSTASAFGVPLDNRPLWDYIRDGELNLPASCRAVAAHPAVGSGDEVAAWTAQLQTCLAEWTPGVHAPLLGDAIAGTARLTPVPRFEETEEHGNNASLYHITGFEPVFLQALWFGNQAPGPACTSSTDPTACRHDPGAPTTVTANSGQAKVTSASALVLECGMLPVAECQRVQSVGGTAVNQFFQVRLTV